MMRAPSCARGPFVSLQPRFVYFVPLSNPEQVPAAAQNLSLPRVKISTVFMRTP
jgi:hypothetical protein